ncbi:MAG TPA: SMC-Scp complex subunit ScpB [Opitutaceae bacterium]|nr:SMC-Scp complex subunit ScpB [Opitutaceae bacterium]
MAFELKKVLKALLFSSGQPLSIKDVQTAIARFHDTAAPAAPGPAAETGAPPAEEPAEVAAGEPFEDPELYRDVPVLVTAAQIREAMEQISLELSAADEGLVLVEGASGWRLATHPRFARWVRILRQEPTPARLSASSLETLAVVAYRQPVTRSEIEAVRGVSAEAGLARLMERELVVITGRADLPGRPLQYGTTDKFLEFLGVRSLDELPASDVLSSRQIDGWLKEAAQPRQLGDAAVGLDEELPLEAAPAAPAGGEHSPGEAEPRAAS